jgi:uncharacterized protein (TIGR03437 family)
MAQSTNGILYGTTLYGGAYGTWGSIPTGGTVFSLSMGMGQFVKTLPTSAKVGAKITILGTNLTGTTSVTFNGVPASFRVVSPTAIRATVPSGASTGPVVVTIPSAMLASNFAFQVLP